MTKITAPKVTRRKITDYLPDSNNANLGTERGLQMLEDSLQSVGVGRSIVVDKNNKIPAGNKTVEAAINAGFEDVLEIEDDGKTLIVHKRTDWDLDDPTGAARQYAYLDNRVSEVGLAWDADVIARDVAAGVDLSRMFTMPEIEYIELNAGLLDDGNSGDDEEGERSDGSLLSLLDITIADPKTEIEHGDVFKLDHHILICVDVITEWALWIPYLKGNIFFCPYPGVFVPLAVKAETVACLLVQPDRYICGHIIDQYRNVKGAKHVRKA